MRVEPAHFSLHPGHVATLTVQVTVRAAGLVRLDMSLVARSESDWRRPLSILATGDRIQVSDAMASVLRSDRAAADAIAEQDAALDVEHEANLYRVLEPVDVVRGVSIAHVVRPVQPRTRPRDISALLTRPAPLAPELTTTVRWYQTRAPLRLSTLDAAGSNGSMQARENSIVARQRARDEAEALVWGKIVPKDVDVQIKTVRQ